MSDIVKVVLSISEIAKLLRDGEITVIRSDGVIVTIYFKE